MVLGIVKILKAIIKPFFSLFLGIMLLVLGVVWAAWIVSYISAFPLINYVGPSPFIFSAIGGLAIFNTVAIPILGLMVLITRWFSSYRLPVKWRNNLRLAWVVSFVVALMAGFGTALSFNNEADYIVRAEYDNSSEPLQVSRMPTQYHKPIGILSSPIPDVQFTRKGLISDDVHIHIERSKTDKVVVETRVNAHGKTFSAAQDLVKKVKSDHDFDNNELRIPSDFLIHRGNKYRGQHIEYTIYIPEGKDIKFTPEMADMVWHRGHFRDNIRPKNLENYTWTMTDKGLASVGWDKEYKAEKYIDAESLENLNIDGYIKTVIEYGDKSEILLKGPRTEIERIEKVETDGTTSLIVDGWVSDRVTLNIKTPKINSLQAKEIRTLKVEGFKQDAMELNINSRGHLTPVKIYVDVDDLTCNFGGSNEVKLLGSGEKLSVNIMDGTRVIAEQYKVKSVDLKGNIYSNSSFYASESFTCPDHERHSVTLYGYKEKEAETVVEEITTEETSTITMQ